MDSRLELQEKLVTILGSTNVYFQPPESIKLKFPAIVYRRVNIVNTYANDDVYKQDDAYRITLIDPNPDTKIMRKISLLRYCRFDQHYQSDNLNHYVFTLYYNGGKL